MITPLHHQFRLRLRHMRHNLAGDVLGSTFGLVYVHKMDRHTADHVVVMVRRKLQVLPDIILMPLVDDHMVGVDFEIHGYAPVLKSSFQVEDDEQSFF
jgi:hypothetical protein